MTTKFTAAACSEADKALIQQLRAEYNLPEKLMMSAILKAATTHKARLDLCAQEVLADKPKRGRKKKSDQPEADIETGAADTVVVSESDDQEYRDMVAFEDRFVDSMER